MKKTKWLQIRVSWIELEKIKMFCEKRNTTVSQLVRKVVSKILQKKNFQKGIDK